MTNVVIFLVAFTIACGGLMAIAEGVIDEYSRRASLQNLRLARTGGLADEIQHWLRHQ